MMVLDANILVRGALGRRVRNLILKYAEKILFLAPDRSFAEAREHLPAVLTRRGLSPEPALASLESFKSLVQEIALDSYAPYETAARQRLRGRDEEDWPVLAIALAFNCPIWTEDTDFFGTGVAVWTTDRIDLYLRALPGESAAVPRE
jgi:predicted nucleic acid-binding protein